MKLVIDGNYIAYRAFYATRPLTNSKGFPTAVIHGFFQFLMSMKDKLGPEEIYVVFDSKEKTKRHEMHADYKATRESMPEDMIPQLEALKGMIPLMGIPVLCINGYEADDTINTLALTLEGEVYIATKDKDLHQLVNGKVKILDLSTNTPMGSAEVTEKFGLPPEKILDMLALSGDASDNIPGVAGVGEKTAQKLLAEFGTLEGVYENIDKVKGKLKEKLGTDKEKAFFSRELATLQFIDNLDMSAPERDDDALEKKLRDLEMNSVLRRLFGEGSAKPNIPAPATEKQPFGSDFTVIASINGEIWMQENGQEPEVKKPEAIPQDAVLYDLKHIYKETGLKPENPRDIMLISWMNEPDQGGLRRMKDEQAEDFITRVRQSAADEIENLEKNNLKKLYEEMEIETSYALAEMEKKGIKLDPERIRQVAKILETELIQLQNSLINAVGHDINLNSPKQLSSFLYDELGIKAVKKTKTGFSTSEEALRDLLIFNPDHSEVILNILRHRELSKLLSTYTYTLINFIDPRTKRIHTEFKQTGTATGRLSSTAPNMQNIPQKGEFAKAIRSAFITEDGYVFVSFDYSQIELRILAHLTGDAALVDAYSKGLDIHTQTASKVFDVPESEVDSGMRRMAKAVNFGIIYGLSAYGLSRDTGVNPKDAQIFIDKYFATYSGVKKFIAETIEEAKKNGFAKTIFGRKRFIADIKSRNRTVAMKGERVAVNTQMQGSAADIIKVAMLNCDKYIKENGLDAHLILQLHDELVFEVKEEIAESFAPEVKRIMESAASLRVPLSVNGSVGKNLGELK
ncbi:DNA polymerase I [Geovibrio thiophilus]|uniref:DNA polymerase I n=1 Tax=Geovibrio thiophilus TaxID=139438 RepID=A0A410JVK3_9BACT|nr:DNA polymerase [Geovibrio thiophilus]QAR32214.1 DNA polymerase I [Geovibrio thiophilus]